MKWMKIVACLIMAQVSYGRVVIWHASSGLLPSDNSIAEEDRFTLSGDDSWLSFQNGALNVNDQSTTYQLNFKSLNPLPSSTDWAFQTGLRMNSHSRSAFDVGATAGIIQDKRVFLAVALDRVGFLGDDEFVGGQIHFMNTTDRFHTYRVVRSSDMVSLYVDMFDNPVVSLAYDSFPVSGSSSMIVDLTHTSNQGIANYDIKNFVYNTNASVIPETKKKLCSLLDAVPDTTIMYSSDPCASGYEYLSPSLPGIPSLGSVSNASVAFSKDERLFVALDNRNVIHELNLIDGTTVNSLDVGHPLEGIAVGANGLIYANYEHTAILEVDFDRAIINTVAPYSAPIDIDSIDFDDSGNLIGSDLNETGNIYHIPLNGSPVKLVASFSTIPPGDMTFSPTDGCFYFYSVDNETLWRLPWEDGRPAGNISYVKSVTGIGRPLGIAEIKASVLFPDDSVYLVSNESETILWSGPSPISEYVRLELSSDDGETWQTIDVIENTRFFEWKVPVVDSHQCFLRVTDLANEGVMILSDQFTISPYPLVHFNDPNLKAAVEDKLGIVNPNTNDMLSLRSLDARKRNITDLTGLEYAGNLEWLNLYDNLLTEIPVVSRLTNLTYLYAGYNDLEIIPDLSGLTKLRTLYLHHNVIDDISPLAIPELTSLQKLWVNGNKKLPIEAYRDQIPFIEENNPHLYDFNYDPNCRNNLKADANGDCVVDFKDFAIMTTEWLTCDYMYQELCSQ